MKPRVMHLLRQLPSHDDLDLVRAPPAAVDALLHLVPQHRRRQVVRVSRRHGEKAEPLLRQQVLHRRADLLPVVDIVTGQLLQRPVVQRLAERLEADQVVIDQVLHAVRQAEGDGPGSLADDDDVEQLGLHRQVPLLLYLERGAGEEVDEDQPEQPVPALQLVHPPIVPEPAGRLCYNQRYARHLRSTPAMATEAPPVPRRRLHWSLRALLVILVLLVVGAVSAWVTNARTAAGGRPLLAAAIEETDELDPRWRWEDIDADRPELPVGK